MKKRNDMTEKEELESKKSRTNGGESGKNLEEQNLSELEARTRTSTLEDARQAHHQDRDLETALNPVPRLATAMILEVADKRDLRWKN